MAPGSLAWSLDRRVPALPGLPALALLPFAD